ncbi:MAG: nucleoid DNA-binding protein [Verrucomicrobia bacterium]|jgi:nucleoid DNA-binding protein|nr:MAG: nucleoid DNA-binding protein [Verrucomicrobiota bacterium]
MAAATEKKEAKKEMTKAEIVTALAEATQMTKTDISAVLGELGNLIGKNVGKKGPGVFTLPGLLKIEVKVKPATKKRMGVNPRTGEPMEISAKPKMRVVRVRPLKGLKDMI